MTILWEEPWSILLAGLALSAVLLVLLVQTGRLIFLGILLVALAITAGLLAVQWWVVTPTERIRGVLYDAAEGVRRNDVNRVLRHIDPEAASLRQEVRSRLSRSSIQDARITSKPNVAIEHDGAAREATARFFARVRAQDARSSLGRDEYVGQFSVHLKYDGARWLITGYRLGQREHW